MATTISPPKQEHEVSHGRRLARWAWVWVGLTAVSWVGDLLLEGYFESEYSDRSDVPWYMNSLSLLLLLIPPATALVLAFLARRADRGAGKVASVVSAVLLEFIVFAVVAGVFQNLPAGIAAAVGVAVLILLAVYVRPGLGKPPAKV
jgi:hypothetical protein